MLVGREDVGGNCSMPSGGDPHRRLGGEGEAVKIVLVDDHQTLAEGLRLLLEAEEDVAVLGVARNGDSGLRVVRGDGPEVIVLDLRSAGTDPASAIAEARAAAPASRILALSSASHAEAMRVARALDGEACDLKDAPAERMVDSMRQLVEGNDVFVSYTPPTPSQRHEPEIELLVRTLSPRERDVLELLTAGYSNQRIAEACFLSMHTVRAHVQSILVKLGVHSKLEAAIFALQHRLVSQAASVSSRRSSGPGGDRRPGCTAPTPG
jgi:two-component system nitrate/nitrite response regulator NarL